MSLLGPIFIPRTPLFTYLIKSTPEGARDFVVPSRMNPGEFYALPQSPQTFKQLLMVAGMDKYFQIVKCFRDEDLRADRQPEFTQIDCEMAFVSQEDILNTFEDLVKHLFQKVKNIKLDKFPVMTYDDAVQKYGTDKPDLRYDMKFVELNDVEGSAGSSCGGRLGRDRKSQPHLRHSAQRPRPPLRAPRPIVPRPAFHGFC